MTDELKRVLEGATARTAGVEMTPGVCGGRPCIRGTRIDVCHILAYLAEGVSFEHIITEFPQLNSQNIRDCLLYAADVVGDNPRGELGDEDE